LVEANDGFLYGTTFDGGKQNEGVLFKITKTGTGFKVLHNFCSSANCADGTIPNSLLLGHDGNLYGTTLQGGSTVTCGSVGCGTIFCFEPTTGAFTVLHRLAGVTDGVEPLNLIQATNGNFYGVSQGLDVNSFNEDIFQLTPAGKFTVQFKSVLFDIGISGLTQGATGNLYGAFESITAGDINFFEVSTKGTGFVLLHHSRHSQERLPFLHFSWLPTATCGIPTLRTRLIRWAASSRSARRMARCSRPSLLTAPTVTRLCLGSSRPQTARLSARRN
jgi:uncharacterized repeat protein (TIGR03803 family)